MFNLKVIRFCQLCVINFLVIHLVGCAALLPVPSVPLTYHSLERLTSRTQKTATSPSANKPSVIINLPQAAAGFNTAHIMYRRSAHQLEYFAHNEWIDTPARMLAPLLVAAISQSSAFNAVILSPSHVTADFKLESEIIRLQQNFDVVPSTVQFTFRAYLINTATRKVVAWREFDESVTANTDNPAGGVLAANQAVNNVLDQLTVFCNESIVTLK